MDSLGNSGEFGCIDADTDCAVMETFDVDLAKSGDTHTKSSPISDIASFSRLSISKGLPTTCAGVSRIFQPSNASMRFSTIIGKTPAFK